jgi:tetratricopeptide (TPR) repeat protein
MLSQHDLDFAIEIEAFINNSDGGFLIVESNNAIKDQELLIALKKRLKNKGLTVDFAKDKKPSLFFNRVKRRLANESSHVIFVTNLYSMTANTENAISLARDLNYNRDIYYNSNKIIIFFFPVFFVDIIIRHARDFFDYVSSSYNIAETNIDITVDSSDFADERQLKNRIAFLEGIVRTRKFITNQDKLDKIAELGNSYLELFDTKSAKRVFSKGLLIATNLGNRNGQAFFLNRLGFTLSRMDKHKQALTSLETALKIFKEMENLSGVAGILNNLSNVYKNKNDLLKALNYSNESCQLFEELADYDNQILVMMNKANILMSMNDLKTALDTLKAALELMVKANNFGSIGKAFTSIARTNIMLGDLESALAYYGKAVYHFTEKNDKEGLAHSYNNISAIHKQRGEYEKAKEYALQALQIVREIQNKRGEIATLRNLIKLFQSLGDNRRSEIYTDELYKLENALGRKNGTANSSK